MFSGISTAFQIRHCSYTALSLTPLITDVEMTYYAEKESDIAGYLPDLIIHLNKILALTILTKINCSSVPKRQSRY